MSEKTEACVNRIREALRSLPKEIAEIVARDAALRAEGVADYLEQCHNNT